MRMPATFLHCIVFGALATSAMGAVVVLTSTTTPPAADAAPAQCTASGLASTASGVLSQAGTYLDSHPDANNVLTAAANQPPDEAKSSVRGYFASHVNELLELQNIAQPLSSLRDQCGVSVSPSQLANLMETLSS
jgi:hemophore-related protein